jgi:hypothetical protein
LGVLPKQFVIECGARAAGRRQPIAGLADPLRGRTTTARRDGNRGLNRKLDHFGPIGGLTHQPTQILHARSRAELLRQLSLAPNH